ncbi:thioredoxin family protein [Flavobacterium sp. CS20]|uniref:thioredoxin family protein n=1 Tax=Flavobacterium sp. CS20 TaxID=2775246 RepID=UPI001B3A4214|nr:thioredoxin family protein [Flavobacterium sp. CS20]QTY26361.1 thioredoxin family protein [Flavobacterium sp. CS20]
MNTITDLKTTIQNALKNSLSYEGFKTLVSNLINKGQSTGHTQNEDMLNYSKLSIKRIKRWDKSFKLSENDMAFFKNQSKPITFLVLAESWCGDLAHALPIINAIAEASPHIDLKVVLRDDNDELMQEFLTNGGKSIPKLIALDDENNVLFTWGPRPTEATEMVKAYKDKHGQLTDELKENLQKWYNKDKG